jgi:hypothetical protein
MPTYAQNELGTSQALANYSIIISQGASIFGRMTFAFIALHTGAMVPWIICVFVSAILCMAWAGIHSIAAFCVFAALYGRSFRVTRGGKHAHTFYRLLLRRPHPLAANDLSCRLSRSKSSWHKTWHGASSGCDSIAHRLSYRRSYFGQQREELSRTATVLWVRDAYGLRLTTRSMALSGEKETLQALHMMLIE